MYFDVGSKFEQALKITLKHEGFFNGKRGWYNHPSDPGGRTIAGITQYRYAQHFKKKVSDVSTTEMKGITDSQIKEIYKRYYWDTSHHNNVKGYDSPLVSLTKAGMMFDAGVNMGPIWGIKLGQRALNELGASLKIDGKIGSITLKHMHAYGDMDFADAFYDEMLSRYYGIIRNKPKLNVFKRGWQNRAASLRKWAITNSDYKVKDELPNDAPVKPEPKEDPRGIKTRNCFQIMADKFRGKKT